MRRCDEVALEQRTDVGGKDAVEEDGELGANGSGIGQQGDDGGGDDERRKEGDHRGVGGGLSEVETVVVACARRMARWKRTWEAQEVVLRACAPSGYEATGWMRRSVRPSTC